MRTYLKAGVFALALLTVGIAASPSAQYQIARGFNVTAFLTIAEYLIVGTADTSGVRMDLESGTLAVREGDDSAYAPLTSGALTASTGTFSGAVGTGALSATTGSFTGVVSGLTDIYTTTWTDYSATSTVTGWSAFTSKSIFYKKVGKFVVVAFYISGTSDATAATFTLPATSAATGPTLQFALGGDITDNGAAVETGAYGALGAASATLTTKKASAGTAWTNTGTKTISGQFWYEAG